MPKETDKSRRAAAIFIADVHWTYRVPEYRREKDVLFSQVIGAKLKKVFDKSKEFGGVPVFIAGDLFDRSREFTDFWTFSQFIRKNLPPASYIPKIYAVEGQHDQLYHDKDNECTSFNLAINMGAIQRMPPSMKIGECNNGFIYACGWGGEYPEPCDKNAHNILLCHRSLWFSTPMFPGQTDGNVYAEAKKLHQLGYSQVFSGDNHVQFDCEIDGVEFHNLGAFSRRDIRLAKQIPRMLVLNDDFTVYSIPLTDDTPVFDSVNSEADKARADKKDEFSISLSQGFDHSDTFKGRLETIAGTGKAGEAELNEKQKEILKDVISSI